jgi:hypothetical protein
MKKAKRVLTYSMMDELTASPTEPTPKEKRTLQLSRMWQGLASMETADTPTTNDWSVCSDAVNLFETLVKMGPIRLCDGSIAEVQDSRGLIMDAITALAMAGRRNMAGGNIRLDASGIQAVRSVLDDYAHMLEEIPHRTMIRCHRITERRLHEILDGKPKPHDIKIP